tara:strand:+ start:702 stop:950 length:249 start_codon:yes stop_codon:yes gene_type:complete
VDNRMGLETPEGITQTIAIHDVTLTPGALLRRIERGLRIEVHDLPLSRIDRREEICTDEAGRPGNKQPTALHWPSRISTPRT